MRYYLPLLFFLVMAVFLFSGVFFNRPLLPSPLIGKDIPRFTLETLDMKLLGDEVFVGEVSLLNVWASWCRACLEEHSHLLRLARHAPIFGLNYKDKREDAIAWLEKLGNPYRLNFFDHSGRVAIDWGVYGAPETFLVDASGKIRYKHVGPLTQAVIDEHLLPLVEKMKKTNGSDN